MKNRFILCTLLTIFGLFPAAQGAGDSELMAGMKKYADNKSVSRADWIAGADWLANNFADSAEGKTLLAANSELFFDGLKNTLTGGNEHKFIEQELARQLRNRGFTVHERDNITPFPPDAKIVASGQIRNASVIADNSNRGGYKMTLKIESQNKTIWENETMLLPPQTTNLSHPSNSTQTTTTKETKIIISGGVFMPPVPPPPSRPIIIINGGGIIAKPPPPPRPHPMPFPPHHNQIFRPAPPPAPAPMPPRPPW